MAKILDIMLALVAYVCVATMITLALGLGYLWQTDRLNDEKVFRIVALLHDVDMNQIAESQQKATDQAPAEEPSLNEVMHHQQVQDRNFEVKLLALQRGRQEYDHSLQLLKEKTDRYDRLAQDWQSKLKQQEELTTQQNVTTVVGQLEQLKPNVGKDSLVRWIHQGRMDDAILLMSKMSETKLAKILKSFETPEELDELHRIHQRIIGGGANTSKLEKALGELNAIDGQK